jgi:hypothetical protein
MKPNVLGVTLPRSCEVNSLECADLSALWFAATCRSGY